MISRAPLPEASGALSLRRPGGPVYGFANAWSTSRQAGTADSGGKRPHSTSSEANGAGDLWATSRQASLPGTGCCAPTRRVSQPSRDGLTCAAPTALGRGCRNANSAPFRRAAIAGWASSSQARLPGTTDPPGSMISRAPLAEASGALSFRRPGGRLIPQARLTVDLGAPFMDLRMRGARLGKPGRQTAAASRRTPHHPRPMAREIYGPHHAKQVCRARDAVRLRDEFPSPPGPG
jgi:hypothetical protein